MSALLLLYYRGSVPDQNSGFFLYEKEVFLFIIYN
jgi:hypothetical protein